eukprot:jgi/Botrbrau1/18747/Bobra.0386s0070.1
MLEKACACGRKAGACGTRRACMREKACARGERCVHVGEGCAHVPGMIPLPETPDHPTPLRPPPRGGVWEVGFGHTTYCPTLMRRRAETSDALRRLEGIWLEVTLELVTTI